MIFHKIIVILSLVCAPLYSLPKIEEPALQYGDAEINWREAFKKEKYKNDFFDALRGNPNAPIKALASQPLEEWDIKGLDKAYKNRLLRIASNSGYKPAVKILLDNGADINYKDPYTFFGEAPLYIALSNKHFHVVKFLLKKGVTLDCDSKLLDTVLQHKHFDIAELVITKISKWCAKKYIMNGKLDTVQFILKKMDISFTDKDNEGDTLLHLAACNEDINVIKMFLKEGSIDINAQNNAGNTPLHIAAANNVVFSVAAELLLQKGADPNLKNRDGDAPLHIAVRKGYYDMMLTLLDNGANINAQNNMNETPLTLAIEFEFSHNIFHNLFCSEKTFQNELQKRRIALIELLLEKGANPNLPVNYPALHQAIADNQFDIVKLLIQNGVNINTQDVNGDTPLHKAVENKNEEITAFLLKQKLIAVNTSNNKGKTPLHLAVCDNYSHINFLLIENGANINAQDANGNTPLHEAIQNGNQGTTDLLLRYNANVNIQNNHGHSPLHIAAIHDNYEAAKTLLENNVLIYLVDKNGNTPLHEAIQNGSQRITNLLLRHNANVNIQNNNGHSPLHVTTIHDNYDAAETLLKNNASIHLVDKAGKTALNLAEENNADRVAEMLEKRHIAEDNLETMFQRYRYQSGL